MIVHKITFSCDRKGCDAKQEVGGKHEFFNALQWPKLPAGWFGVLQPNGHMLTYCLEHPVEVK